jgi:aspartyl-tRNA synthetase
MNPYRSHLCNEIRPGDVGKTVRLSGWIHNKRDHGGVLFIDLRDHYGITQLVSNPGTDIHAEISHLPKETVITAEGEVLRRSGDTVNSRLETGEVEVVIASFEILGACENLPFSVFPEEKEPEELRLRYRFIDLRRSGMHENIVFRSRVVSRVREVMTGMGFLEIQTPILTASSPEGARDYLVPSRIHPGRFYALPQAPQQYKQLLMVSGFDRYFQIAPCFRDEDARANRSPGEFYQIDMELAFATQEDVFAVVENLFTSIFNEFSDRSVDSAPFPRIPYREAMLKYGTDKPDLRNPIVIRDVTEAFRGSGFKAFAGAIEKGSVVRAVPVRGIAGRPRSFYDGMIEYAQSIGSKGLAYMIWSEGEVKSPLTKFVTPDRLERIAETCGVGNGDAVFFVCAKEKEAVRIAGDVRIKLGLDLDLLEKECYRFCWIVDYPMYEGDPENQRPAFSHNPFSMPQGGLDALESTDPLQVLAYQYDIVCNGEELSSGAVRNHRPDIMYKAFEIAGYTREDVDEKFHGMINAFKMGAPPHAGIAPGLDRIVMLLKDVENLREVVAYPMNQKAQDLMMNAPREVSDKQLEELHIRVVSPGED